jgi:hypothetical protein
MISEEDIYMRFAFPPEISQPAITATERYCMGEGHDVFLMVGPPLTLASLASLADSVGDCQSVG